MTKSMKEIVYKKKVYLLKERFARFLLKFDVIKEENKKLKKQIKELEER